MHDEIVRQCMEARVTYARGNGEAVIIETTPELARRIADQVILGDEVEVESANGNGRRIWHGRVGHYAFRLPVQADDL